MFCGLQNLHVCAEVDAETLIIQYPTKMHHIKWDPYHHDMAHPEFADGEDSLQVWMVATNRLDKQSREADSGWSSSLVLGGVLTTPHRKNILLYELFHRASDLILCTDLSNGKWI
jgi:hypothetical protein